MIGELIATYNDTLPKRRRKRVRAVIDAIRSLGIGVELDRQNALAILTKPQCVPYPLLVEFVELQLYIADALDDEDAERIADKVGHMPDLQQRMDYVHHEQFRQSSEEKQDLPLVKELR